MVTKYTNVRDIYDISDTQVDSTDGRKDVLEEAGGKQQITQAAPNELKFAETGKSDESWPSARRRWREVFVNIIWGEKPRRFGAFWAQADTLFEYPPGKPIEAKLLTELLNLVVPSYEDERKKSATVRTVKKSSDYSRASGWKTLHLSLADGVDCVQKNVSGTCNHILEINSYQHWGCFVTWYAKKLKQ